MTTIVVGIDTSDGARRALRWAIDEAHLRGAKVTAVHAWQVPYFLATPFGAMPLETNQFEASIQGEVDAMIDAAELEAPDVPIERVVTAGNPAGVLLEAAADADLLVVGTRGRGGFADLLLGSVSNQVAQHAPCPVVIVP